MDEKDAVILSLLTSTFKAPAKKESKTAKGRKRKPETEDDKNKREKEEQSFI